MMRGERDVKKERGLTFLEILISIIILIIVFFTTYQIFVGGLRFFKRTQNSTKLMKLAQSRIEQIAQNRIQGAIVDEPWTPFPGNSNYRYNVSVSNYLNYSLNPLYDIVAVELTGEGPLRPDGQPDSLTQTIVLKTVVTPIVDNFPGACAADRAATDGSSTLLPKGGEK
jgi:Tfp pilus assembly protein PilE